VKLAELVATSSLVARRGGRLEKIEAMAELLRRVPREEVATAVSYLAGELPQGRIGVGWSTLRKIEQELPADAAREPSLTLREVDDVLARVAATSGSGSTARRREQLQALLARATADERRFLVRLLLGELRQGALEGVMLEAVSRAAGIPARDLRRAAMLAGELRTVASDLLASGPAALDAYGVELFRPLKPMLAQPADDWDVAFARHELLGLEYKVDGARIQVHRRGPRVEVYSRSLRNVTVAVPEVVEAVLAMPVEELILDGEVAALRADGTPQPFQVTMRRFGRKLEHETLRRSLPLAAYFFDCLYVAGEPLIDEGTGARWQRLAGLVAESERMPRLVTGDPETARGFLRRALEAGHEGVMAKALDASYEAGGRGQSWLKLKPAHTLDLVVLAAEWGSGRRRGTLSNLHLGAGVDGTSDQFVMLGKTFKGLTDKMLAWQTEHLLALEVSREGHVVYVRPELVVEIAFNDVQESPHYPAGLALRFARVRAHRPDKPADEADTLAAVQAIHARTHPS
jgi:DNA ligase-1